MRDRTMIDVVFRHLSGSRATEVDTVPLGAHRELILGRALSAAVRLDAKRDSVVGRHHARIVPMDGLPPRFVIVDLRSRNGTYLNGRRIYEQAQIRPGDVVQLGEGGPELEFQFAIRPEFGERSGP
jgi:serine protease Do